MAPRIPRLVTALVVLPLLFGGCTPGGTSDVALAVLADEQEAWHGRAVRAEGVLRTFDDPRHYWIEDDALNRVELVPHDGLADLVGRRVRVEGTFTFREGEGRRLAVEDLEVLDDGQVASLSSMRDDRRCVDTTPRRSIPGGCP